MWKRCVASMVLAIFFLTIVVPSAEARYADRYRYGLNEEALLVAGGILAGAIIIVIIISIVSKNKKTYDQTTLSSKSNTPTSFEKEAVPVVDCMNTSIFLKSQNPLAETSDAGVIVLKW